MIRRFNVGVFCAVLLILSIRHSAVAGDTTVTVRKGGTLAAGRTVYAFLDDGT